MSERIRVTNPSVSMKWETFQPRKIEGKVGYTRRDIADAFGISESSVNSILIGKDNCNPVLRGKVRSFAEDVQYGVVRPENVWMCPVDAALYANPQERRKRMMALRDKGYTNAQIARMTGHSHLTVLKIIGRQPKEYTAASYKRAGQVRKMANADRKAVAMDRLRKRIAEANAQVTAYNAAVDELARLDEAMDMAKKAYDQQRSAVEKMKDALSLYADMATIPAKSVPDA